MVRHIAFDWAETQLDEFTAIRHDLHRHPETAFEEHRTADIVAKCLESYGIEVHRGLAKTGVVGVLKNGDSDKSIGLRADMDALDILEQNDFSHKSTIPGKMHGCGHDGHTTMLLAAAKYLAEHKPFDGTVHFIFQPAEENEGGGRVMVEDGLFDKFKIDSVYGMHNFPGVPLGHFCIQPGPMMAGFDIFEIEVNGVGGHAAMPHAAVDSVVVASHIVTALQSIIARSTDPQDAAVVSVTRIEAGHTYNVLPEKATMAGTVRYFSPDVQNIVEKRMHALCENVGAAFGAKVKVTYEKRYPPTLNTEKETQDCQNALRKIAPEDTLNFSPTPSMGAEDFAWMLQEKPGAYVWAGNGLGSEGGCTVHNPHYDFNDKLIPHGTAYWVNLTTHLLPA